MILPQGAATKKQKKYLDYWPRPITFELRNRPKFNWRYSDSLEHGSARRQAQTGWMPDF